jgi:hypothetical protein
MADPLHDALVKIYEYAKNGDERSTDGRDTSLVNIGRVARLAIRQPPILLEKIIRPSLGEQK